MFALVKNETVTDPVTQESSLVQNVKLFSPYSSFEDKDGVQYAPSEILNWTAAQKEAAGIYDVAQTSRPDDRFYTVVQNSPEFDASEKIVKITFTATPKELDDSEPDENGLTVKGLKSQWISLFKSTANSLLSSSDWMLVRKIERNIDIPANTATHRAAVISEAARLESEIAASTDIDSFITAVSSADWPTVAE